MNKKAFKTLEFNKVLEKISHYAVSTMAKKRLLALEPFENILEVKKALNETTESVQAIMKLGIVPIRGIKDISSITKRLEVHGNLSIIELLQLADTLRAAKQVKSYYSEGRALLENLTIGYYFSGLEPLPSLYNEIARCIISENEIADDASSDLRKIRNNIKQSSSKIKSALNKVIRSAFQAGYLQDNIITMRNDRYCLPVKAEYKNHVKGMIHDQSGTGSTLFIEPLAVVELNNKLGELALEEQKEIGRILTTLSVMASNYVFNIAENTKLMAEIDFIFAKANYSMMTKSSIPKFNENYEIYLKNARHPLLDPTTVVPTTIYLGRDFTTLVITGPNTGGKTVTLKTLGLMCLMGQSGLHVPASDGAKLTMIDNIFADIGDEQSIEQSLSTFSSHMTNITTILEKVTDKSLVLFDELGAGTDPTEGAALATAILESLREANILTVATTHYSELKVYALSTKGVENASCEFNVTTLRPTYKLLIGIPGKSNAFAISKRLGLSDYIIDKAKLLLSTHEVRFEDLITELEVNRKSVLLEKERAEKYHNETLALQKKVELQKASLEERKARFLEKANQEASSVLEEAKENADKIIREMNSLVKHGTNVDMKELEKRRSELRDNLKKHNKPVKKANSNLTTKDFHIGDLVYVTSLSSKGNIVNINAKKKELTVQLGIIKSKVSFNDVRLVNEDVDNLLSTPKKNTGKKWTAAKGNMKKGGVYVSRDSSVNSEIDLRGTNALEAIEMVDKYLDTAYMSHLPSVRLIHGKGTGVLRQAITNYLKKAPHVKKYRLGEYGEGGNGVTVVEFKD